MNWPILSVVTFLPLLGVLFILTVKGEDATALRNVRWGAFWTTLVTFLLSLLIWIGFDSNAAGFQFVEQHAWLGAAASYKLGVDGFSMPFVILTTFLMPICILASWHVTKRVKEYMIAFLVLETLMIGVFCSLDIVLFYLFFEAGLIPMFLIIGIFTAKEAKKASHSHFWASGVNPGLARSWTISVVPVVQYM